MEQYISKSALLAEIKRRETNIKEYCFREGHDKRFDVIPEQLSQILSFIDTLEVKEVNLEKEVESLIKSFTWRFADKEDFLRVAKHFFELGMQQSKNHNNNEE